jgi:hypothetical protein
MSTVLASAADERYGYHLLNLIGSVKANSDLFDRIVVYDLGLSARQRRLVHGIRDIEVRTVPPFVPHWAQCFTWKPWVWTHLEALELVWLDAGITVLRSLAEPLEQIRERGYFVVSQGQANREIMPSDYYELYGFTQEMAAREYVAAGIIGFDKEGDFYRRVILPTYEDVLRGRNLGFSQDEAERLNFGLNKQETVIIRDCRVFRWDQTLLNAHLFTALADPWVNELPKYGGHLSARDHPDQLIWSHRRRGDYRYLWRVPYTWRARPYAWPFTLWFRARWRYRQYAWLFRPRTYVDKLRRLAGSRASL